MFVVFVVAVSAAKKDKRRKKDRDPEHEDSIEALTKRVEELEQNLGSASGNEVHFYFHGDGDHDSMHSVDDKHVHVDVHLNRDGRHSMEEEHFHHEHVAVCTMKDVGIEGNIVIAQADNDRSASFKIQFDKLGKENTEHKLHVHKFGDMSDKCMNIGGHYDPYHKDVDVGDLGTISTDGNGGVPETWKNDTHLTLFGEYSIVGRSIMVHDEDGKGLACCAIGWSPETHDHFMDHSHGHDHSAHNHDHSADHHDHSADHDHHEHHH